MNLNSVLRKDDFTKDEIAYLLSLRDKEEVEKLFARANEVREEFCGDEVHLRGIIEFSNYCGQNCLYCGLRNSNRELQRYRMTKDEILQTVKHINDAGIKTVILQSGEDFGYRNDFITDIIKSIKINFDVAVTLSLGERGFHEYNEWQKAGADRYLLKHETANEKIYYRIHHKQKLEERLLHLRYLKAIGFQTGSGNIIGLPHQTAFDLADDILLCKELDCDMASFSPFIPSLQTPFYNVEKADLTLTLKTIAVARIVLKDVHIPATTALGTLDVQGREKGLQVGANVIMPNFTPNPFRQHYQIYPNKKDIADEPLACCSSIRMMIESFGRKIARDKGGSLKSTTLKIKI
jgi:biotin synthase